MTKKNTKSVSFTAEYGREYEYVVTLPNASRYICELIRKDIESRDSDLTILKQQADELINKIRQMEERR